MSKTRQTLTIQQALDLAIRHHAEGRLSQAETVYQQILQSDPDQPAALHLLGVLAHQEGHNDLAVSRITKALAMKPNMAEAHSNLGLALHDLGKLEESAISYHKALELKPDFADAHGNLARTLRSLGRSREAVASYRKALALRPDAPEAHYNLGNALRDLGMSEEAVKSYHKALDLKPEYVDAHNNLGLTLWNLGRQEEALASYHKALDLNPDYADAHNNLGIALRDCGKLDKAVACYRRALALKPDYVDAHNNLGNVLRDLRRLEEAENAYEKALSIGPNYPGTLANYGALLLGLGRRQDALSCFRKKIELVRGKSPINPNIESFCWITRAKMQHDIEQFRHLEKVGNGTNQFGHLARTYTALDHEILWPDANTAPVALTKDQRKRIGNTYNRPVHIVEAPEIPGAVLNPNLNVNAITQNYMGNTPEMTYFDNLLSPKALCALRRFLMESTVWYDFKYTGGYLGAFLADGLACPLLLQIADELRETFPDIFKAHPLYQLWAYKYDSELTGINVHADAAAVNVNFWVTPDSANLNPNNGGLIVHKKEAPMEWGFKVYNTATERIRDFLSEPDRGKMVVPYAANRAVMFNSNLFHETDRLEFKTGYENRRINITMLFGSRWNK